LKPQTVILLAYLMANYLALVAGLLIHPYLGVVLGAVLTLSVAQYARMRRSRRHWAGRRRSYWAA
jgi:hypothetical protein